MNESIQEIKTEFHRLVVRAFKEGLALLKPVILEKRWIDRHYNWPRMSHFAECGLPCLFTTDFSGPVNYSEAFVGSSPIITDDKLPCFKELLSFTKNQKCLMGHLFPQAFLSKKEGTDFKERQIKISVYLIPSEMIDRYIHIYKTCEYLESAFQKIYEPYEQFIFHEMLGFEIYVPILFLKFDFDEIILDHNTGLKKMDELFQLSRASIGSYDEGVHKRVLSAATHALVLSGWEVKNQDEWTLSNLFGEISVYPINLIDKFFAALRIVTGHYTGYAQIIIKPKDWAHDYKADLEPIHGTSIKAYPDWFGRDYWNNKNIPELDKIIAGKVGKIYSGLLNAEENSVDLAAKRLNLCFLRNDEQDTILDATIGLETLLSDDNRQEMTHKLAMRIGALAKLSDFPSKSPYQVFQDIKDIYSYRSAIVHGSTKAVKKREIISVTNEHTPASSMAIEYLRFTLDTLIKNAKYRDPKKIDEDLLLGNIENEETCNCSELEKDIEGLVSIK